MTPVVDRLPQRSPAHSGLLTHSLEVASSLRGKAHRPYTKVFLHRPEKICEDATRSSTVRLLQTVASTATLSVEADHPGIQSDGDSEWLRNVCSASSRSLVALFDSGSLGTRSDRDLLEHFQSDDGPTGQEAFRILVERHGPMVLGLCRSLVRDQHEAEDAFQATFLVLVRKAASIKRRDTLGPWLYGVATRVARRARGRLIRRHLREVPVVPSIPARDRGPSDELWTDQLVHEEIAKLPDPFRRPLILCCLQGLSYDLAAKRLGLKEPTLRGRLERARKRLASRLRGRGLPALVAGPALESVRGSMPPLPSGVDRIDGSVLDALVFGDGPPRRGHDRSGLDLGSRTRSDSVHANSIDPSLGGGRAGRRR